MDARSPGGAQGLRLRNLPAPPASVVVILSGGPDSVALTLALSGVGGYRLTLFHLNHCLRGEASDGDEAFVRELHQRLSASPADVTLTCLRLDIGAVAAAEGGNVEAVARRERYRLAGEVAAAHGASIVATGHNADDQAETVLHRLLRGTGPDGLRGIAPRRQLVPGVELVRPLLGTTRREIDAYLETLGVTARHDASNDDTAFTRNRIRRDLLPLLAREYNPRVAESLARIAAHAEEVTELETEVGDEALAAATVAMERGRATLSVAVLRPMSRGRRRLALRRLWRRMGWPEGEMGFVAYERVAALVDGEGTAWDLPGGVRAIRRRGEIVIEG